MDCGSNCTTLNSAITGWACCQVRLACALEMTPGEDDAPITPASEEPCGAAPLAAGAEVKEAVAQVRAGAAGESAESTSERLHRFLLESLAAGCEGLMLKTLEGVYEPGRRADTWLKMKKVRLAPISLCASAMD